MAASIHMTHLAAVLTIAATAHAGICRWEFVDCEKSNHTCLVVVRESSPCRPKIHRLTARAAAPRLGNLVASLCDLRECTLSPRPCPWEAWVEKNRNCYSVSFVRTREPCCHPVTHESLNVSCGFTERDFTIHLLNNCDPQDQGSAVMSDDEAGEAIDERNRKLLICFLGVVLALLFVSLIVAQRHCRRRSTARLDVPLTHTHAVPECAIVPHPGHPVDAQHLPCHFHPCPRTHLPH